MSLAVMHLLCFLHVRFHICHGCSHVHVPWHVHVAAASTMVATPTTTFTAASGCAEMEHSKLEYPRHTGKSPRKYICIYDDMNINGMSCKVHLPIMSMYNYENKKWFFCIHLYKHTDSSPSLYIYTGRPKRGAIPVSVNGSVIAMTTKGKSFS